jgi:hypothetical protein
MHPQKVKPLYLGGQCQIMKQRKETLPMSIMMELAFQMDALVYLLTPAHMAISPENSG